MSENSTPGPAASPAAAADQADSAAAPDRATTDTPAATSDTTIAEIQARLDQALVSVEKLQKKNEQLISEKRQKTEAEKKAAEDAGNWQAKFDIQAREQAEFEEKFQAVEQRLQESTAAAAQLPEYQEFVESELTRQVEALGDVGLQQFQDLFGPELESASPLQKLDKLQRFMRTRQQQQPGPARPSLGLGGAGSPVQPAERIDSIERGAATFLQRLRGR